MRKAFTFTEILVVIAVMSILTFVLIPNLLAYLDRIKADKLELDIIQFRKEASLFFERHGHWPGRLNDIVKTRSGNPVSPYKTLYEIEGPFVTVNVPRGSNVYMGSPSAIEAQNGKLKFLLKDVFVIARYGEVEHKIFPVKITSYSGFANGAAWMAQAARPGSRGSYMLFYFTLSSTDNSMHMVVSVNKPSAPGNISAYSISDIFFSNINPTAVSYNSTYNASAGTLNRTGILNTYSGTVFSMDLESTWNVKMNIDYITSSGECYLGYISGDQNNVNKFGFSGESDEYTDREIEFEYKY